MNRLAVRAFVVTILLASGAAPVAVSAATPADLASWVNPLSGTQPGDADMGTGGGAANTFPGADVPFGMVQFSPDTVTQQHGGYAYDDNRIADFSLTHLSGAGCDTYQDIPFMPIAGEVTSSPAVDPMHYISTFSHRNETVSAGTYRVGLDNGVTVELSATKRTGAARLNYPTGAPATLLINTAGSIMGTSDAQISIGNNEISGYADSGHFCGRMDTYRVYFSARFDQPFQHVGTWKNAVVTPGKDSESGGNVLGLVARDVSQPSLGSGGYVTFDTHRSTTVGVRVGLSFVSVDGARNNLAVESAKTPFPQVCAQARQAWNERLNRIRVAGGSADQRTVFYTALYHALLQPNVFSDVDGRYIGFDQQLHATDPGHPIYSNFSGWDIYRSEVQLLALIAPREAADIAQSMVLFAAQGGSFDRWTVANGYTGVMNGDPYPTIISSMHAFGATAFDARQALALMVRGATIPTSAYVERPWLIPYETLGYVPTAAATTLEYTTADFAISQLAERLGAGEVHATMLARAQNWRNLFNPATRCLQPRTLLGAFASGFDPANPTGYTEGNGAQYTWMVPFNYRDLIADLGGNAAVTARLDAFFTKFNVGTHEPYAFLGNEPTLETPWIYDFAGAPYRTQDVVNRARQQLWKPGPNGFVGNDDLGEMSSWYVWAALGLYPEIPGRAELTLNSPEFSSATITRPSGQTIHINAPGASTATPYIKTLRVNGQIWSKPWLPESFAANGGTLDFSLAATPDPRWGAAPGDAPPSFG